MNVKEKGQPGIYTKVYGYVPKDAEIKSFNTEKGKIDYVVFDLVYDTGSVDRDTKAPISKGIRCEVSASKLNGELPKKGSKLEVAGPLRIDYNKEKKQTYISLKVAELSAE
jgi:hypothetical protein